MLWKKWGGTAFSSSQEHSPAAQRMQQQKKGKSKFSLPPRYPISVRPMILMARGHLKGSQGFCSVWGPACWSHSLFSSFSPTGLNSGALQERSSGSGLGCSGSPRRLTFVRVQSCASQPHRIWPQSCGAELNFPCNQHNHSRSVYTEQDPTSDKHPAQHTQSPKPQTPTARFLFLPFPSPRCS